jgi:acetyltransferase-like isoleucine patch superfamily enzyme
VGRYTKLKRRLGDDLALMALSAARNSATRTGGRARRAILRRVLASCGERASIGHGAYIHSPRHISVGDGLNAMPHLTLYAAGDAEISIGSECSFNVNVQILAGPRGRIEIGDNVLIGPNSVLRNCDHAWRDPDRLIRDQGHDCRDIVIHDNVWISANVVILGGVEILPGSVVGASAVVRPGVYGPRTLLVGNPAVVKAPG